MLAASSTPLEEVVLVAAVAQLPENAALWPVRILRAADCPEGVANAYVCGSAHDVEEILPRFRETLGLFADAPLPGAAAASGTAPQAVVLPALEQGFTAQAWEELVSAVCSRHVATMQDMILARARETPDKIALIYEDTQLTYQNLVSMASCLRRYLRAEGYLPEKGPMAVRMEASALCAITYLGLYAGRFTMHILDESVAGQFYRIEVCPSQAVLCLSAQPAESSLPLPRIFVDQLDLDSTIPVASVEFDKGDLMDKAFIEYTSGSTGKPKSVATVQYRIAHWVRWHSFVLPERDTRDAYCLFYPWYWHISLCQGHTCVVWPQWMNKDLEALMKYFGKHRVNRINCLTPGQISVLLSVVRELPPDIRMVLSGGEALPMATVTRWLEKWPNVPFVVNYATTEAAADVSFVHVHKEWVQNWGYSFAPMAQDIIVWNNTLELVDDEIVITGWGVAPGYLPPTESPNFEQVDADGIINRYRSGDKAKWIDGKLMITGRLDDTIKVRGYRVDVKGLQSLLAECAEVIDVYTLPWKDSLFCLVRTLDLHEVKAFAKKQYDKADLITWLQCDSIPITKSGKKDKQAIVDMMKEMEEKETLESEKEILTPEEQRIAAAFKEVLGRPVGRLVPFLQAGGNSLTAMHLSKKLGLEPAAVFRYPTIAALAAAGQKQNCNGAAAAAAPSPVVDSLPKLVTSSSSSNLLAVVGMAGRFPGAASVAELWKGLEEGRLMTSPVPGATALHVQRKGLVPDLGFDSSFWKIPKENAAMMDTAQRTLLEVAYEALADAGLDPQNVDGRVGVVVCGGSLTHYASDELGIDLEESRTERPDEYFTLEVGTDKDYVATSISFYLNLQGPSEVVQSACSSGLVAIARAVQMLKWGLCDYVLCGGASFSPDAPVRVVDGLIWAPDGVCRPFADGGNGTTNADGAGLVLLTRLDAARSRGQRVYSTVLGAATNNDGRRKAGYSAPSYEGQVDVLRAAHADAGISGVDLDYVEGHGTGTKLGDPIEVQALTEVIGTTKPVLLGSVKGNIGHMNTAAGVPGFIKTALMLHHQRMVPSLHASRPSSMINWDKTSLRLAAAAEAWPGCLAAVSSFGVGGTNAHVVLGHAAAAEDEQAASTAGPVQVRKWQRDSLVEEREAIARRQRKRAAKVAEAAAQKAAATAATERQVAARKNSEAGQDGLFYEVTWEQVQVSELSLTRAAVVWDGGTDPKLLPQGMPADCVIASPERALVAARAMGGALVFLGTGDQEPGIDDESQEELLFTCMEILKALARESRERLEVFFVLRANLRYSGLLGLVRSALHEHPELQLRLLLQEEGAPRLRFPALAGELVLTAGGDLMAPRLVPSSCPPSAVAAPPKAQKALVTGGLRGLGLAVAEWLAATGRAASLVLLGRTGVAAAPEALQRLAAKVPTEVRSCDVSNWSDVEKLPADCDLVIHCAGNVKDGLLLNLTTDDAKQVLRPKIRGAVHLKKRYPSSRMIAFSSSSGLFGTPGQSTYAAGNTFVDAIMPSVQWGGWGGTGMAVDLGIDPVGGERFLSVDEGMECLGRIMDGPDINRKFCILDVDWAIYRQVTTVFAPDEPFLARVEAGTLSDVPSALGKPCRVLENRGDGYIKSWTLILGAAGSRWKGTASLWELCQQHVVDGVPVFPATGFVALALEAASLALKSSLVKLSDVVFLRPLELGSTRQLVISLSGSTSGGNLRFSSRTWHQDASEMAKATVTLHCTCNFAPAVGFSDVLWCDDGSGLPMKGLYGKFASAGFFYGPSFQGSEFVVSPTVARCVLPTVTDKHFSLHPGALDVAGQLGSLLHPLGFRGAPQSIERLTATVGAGLHTACCQLAASGELLEVQTQDAAGNISCHIEGLAFAEMIAPATLRCTRRTWKEVAAVPRGNWRVLGEAAKCFGLSQTVEAESSEPHDAVVLAVQAKTLADVHRCQAEVRRQAALTKCWLLASEDEGAMFAEAAAAAAVEVGAQAVFGSRAALLKVAPDLGVDAKGLMRAEIADGGQARLLVQATESAEEAPRLLASRSEPFVATIDPSKGSKGAQCRLTHRQPRLSKGEVEIHASLWALNFRDVLVAVGAISTTVAGKSLGIGGECYGKVTAVGEGVTGVAVGDQVIAVPPDGMGSYATVDARWVSRAPAGMTAEEAVAGTAVYATAWQALHWMARIRRGDRVLIHSAAGGVGLAAVHLCKKAGCVVYATASTPEKRSLLLSLGVEAAFNSRSVPDFESGVRKATDGKGVHVVLNSLSGEAISASLRLLRPMGHFVEIGKRDQYEDTKIGLNPFLKGISYCAAHLDVLMLEEPDRCRELLEEVWEALPSLPCLPTKTFGMADLSAALEYFSQGVHIGKVLVSVEDCMALPARPTQVEGPAGDLVAEGLKASLLPAAGGTEPMGGFGVLCVPQLSDLLLQKPEQQLEQLRGARLVLTASPAVAALSRALSPDATCVELQRWEPVTGIDEWLALGGYILASEEADDEDAGDLHTWLMEIVEEMAGPIGMDESFEDAGLDSLNLISLARRLSAKVNKAISVADLSDHPTPRQLLDSFSGTPQPQLVRPKAVCIHGFRSNRDAMAVQMGPMVSTVGSVEWVFVNSPRAASGPAAPKIPMGEAREWWGQEGGPYETAWLAPNFQGLEATLPVLQRMAPVGAVGFSQGGAMAALLEDCAWVALFSPVVAPGLKQRQTPCFLSYDPTEEYVEQCKEVGTHFSNLQLRTHSVGHDLPRDSEFCQTFAAFVNARV